MQVENDHESPEAGPIVEAGAGSTPALRPLGDLPDYDVADDDPDIRGWEVIASDGGAVGRVHELIVDAVAMEVRYAEVALTAGGEHVLLPLGVLRIAEGASAVAVDGLDAARVVALPRYRGSCDDAYERSLCARIAGDAPADSAALFDTREFWGHWSAGRAGTAFLVEMGRLRRGQRRRRPRTAEGGKDRRAL